MAAADINSVLSKPLVAGRTVCISNRFEFMHVKRLLRITILTVANHVDLRSFNADITILWVTV